MGCDIHCYIEHKRRNDEHWESFGGKINPGRDYAMFTLLAGVRPGSGAAKLFKPKGCPEELSYEARDDNYCFISESASDRYVTKEKAAQWVAAGMSKYIDNGSGQHVWVTHPDWHSHSWLTAAELAKAFELYGDPDVEYRTILDCLLSFERQGHEARLVFWFDN